MQRALAPEPVDRYQSAADMRRSLTDLLRHSPVTTDAKLLATAVADARDALGVALPSRPPPPVGG